MRRSDLITSSAIGDDGTGLFREFLLILAGGAIGSALGSGFGTLVGALSPEFIEALAHPHSIHTPERTGTAMGMIGGLLVGAAAMVAGRLVGAIRVWAGLRDGERVARNQALQRTSEA